MKIIPKAPLFRDPIFNGAADPVVIYNKKEKSWWMLYTNRRASAINHGASFFHGSEIGIATSNDNGANWIYRGTLSLEFEHGKNTFWAPEVVFAAGQYHMYISYVQGIPDNFYSDKDILHYTSNNLWDWKFESKLCLSSNIVIDACVHEIAPNVWKMWYKDEINNSSTYSAISYDLYNWKVLGPEVADRRHEGSNVFSFKGYNWMITDPWHGLDVYRSDDFENWELKNTILNKDGVRTDDSSIANHADVVVCGERAYIFYHTHPEITMEERTAPDFIWEYRHRRSSIQVAELKFDGETLTCNRDNVKLELTHI